MTRNSKIVAGLLIALGTILLGVWIVQLFVSKDAPAPTKPTETFDSEKIRESIVRIESENNPPIYGTGFFVAPDKLATNIHVVAASRPIIAKKIHLVEQFARTDEKRGTGYGETIEKETVLQIEGVMAHDVKNDLVILKVATESTPLPIANSNNVKVDASITVTAYPAPYTFMGIQGKSYRVEKGTIYSIRKSDKWLRMEIDLRGGSSGSPVLNSMGHVVGICAGSSLTFGYSLAIPSNALKKLLSKSKTVESLAEWQKRKLIRSYAYCVKAQESFNVDLYADAIVALDKAVQLNPKSIYAYTLRGQAKFSIGMSEAGLGNSQKAVSLYKAAVDDYTHAIKVNPKNANAYSSRAQAKFELGNRKAAIADYEKAIKINYKHEQTYSLQGLNKSEQADFEAKLGNLENAQRLYEDAIEFYTYALERAPKSHYYYLKRATAKSNLAKTKAAQGDAVERKHSEKALRLYEAALQDFTRAIQLNPKHSYAYSNRGWVKYLIGKSEATVGKLEAAQKRYDTAIADYNQAIQLDAANAYAFHNRGVLKAALGDTEEAITDFDDAIRIDPRYANAYYKRALAKESLGHKAEAKTDFEKARELDPNVGK